MKINCTSNASNEQLEYELNKIPLIRAMKNIRLRKEFFKNKCKNFDL
jgi:hypothetical protein